MSKYNMGSAIMTAPLPHAGVLYRGSEPRTQKVVLASVIPHFVHWSIKRVVNDASSSPCRAQWSCMNGELRECLSLIQNPDLAKNL